jgi:signal transduction histidine kinase
LSERVWALEEFEQGTFQVDPKSRLKAFDVIQECVDSLAESARANQLVMTVDPSLRNWPALRVDKRLFTQAILNLLDNAVKYSAHETEIRIDGDADVGNRRIRFGNRGLGIRPEEFLDIFDKFYRTKHAQLWIKDGTGIGLSIVKKFAEIYGDVQVQSSPIVGSRDHLTIFTLSLDRDKVEHV